jgi:hypothetical protein
MLLFVIPHLWSIIGDSGFVVSSILPSGVALLSFHMPTGKLGSRPVETVLFTNKEIDNVQGYGSGCYVCNVLSSA